jgi:hypothetical protein
MILQLGGWIGTALLIGGYLLVSSGKLEGKSIPFNLINVVGAALMVVATAAKGVWSSVALNLIWVAIGTRAILGLLRSRGAKGNDH